MQCSSLLMHFVILEILGVPLKVQPIMVEIREFISAKCFSIYPEILSLVAPEALPC